MDPRRWPLSIGGEQDLASALAPKTETLAVPVSAVTDTGGEDF